MAITLLLETAVIDHALPTAVVTETEDRPA